MRLTGVATIGWRLGLDSCSTRTVLSSSRDSILPPTGLPGEAKISVRCLFDCHSELRNLQLRPQRANLMQ